AAPASFLDAVVRGLRRPRRDAKLGQRLARFAPLVLCRLLLRGVHIVPAGSADHRAQKHDQEGKREPGEPITDPLCAASGLVGHAIDEAMSHFDNMQADALTVVAALAKGRTMIRAISIIGLVAAAALAGCNNEDHNIISGPDTGEVPNAAANANVQLPPSIAATKIYRCADNKIVYDDWMSDNKSANI